MILAGLGGCVGAMARVGLSGAIARAMDRAGFWSAFPIATFCVNALGSLLIGFLLALNLTQSLRVLFVAGALGGFTTFSTFSYDTLQLLLAREFAIGMLNVVLTYASVCCFAMLGCSRAERLQASRGAREL